MQVKVFTGPGTQDVLAQIKNELGPDAVILSSREFRKDGQRLFEITAGIERGSTPAEPSATPPGWEEWHKEWALMKGHLYALMQPAIQWERLNPRQRVALEYMQREGVDNDVLLELYQGLLRSEGGGSMLTALTDLVPVKPWNSENWPQWIHVLTGPYGSGKTTTALRLAMHLRSQDKNHSIAFLNADSTRGNGRLVLRHWAELSDFQYFESPDAQTLHAALRAAQGEGIRTVFIDLPGLTPGQNKNEDLTEKLNSLGLNVHQEATAKVSNIAVHLTLPPYYAPVQLAAFLQRYRTALPGSLIWTKLDEAVNFGSLVNVAAHSKLPISALSFGPELQSSLVSAQESQVWRLLLKRQLPQISPSLSPA